MKRQRLPSLLIGLALSLVLQGQGEAVARTWTVAKDGSGDYSVIQDALDVCAAGDSVLIGAGRYDEFRVHTYQLGGTASVIMIPKVAPLTIIGSHRDSVVIGPDQLTIEYQGHQTGIFVGDSPGSQRLVLNSVTLENAEWLAAVRSPHTFSYCRFLDAGEAAIGLENAPDVVITGCEFDRGLPVQGQAGILAFVGGVNPRLTIIDSSFRRLAVGVQITGSDSFEFKGLGFEEIGAAFAIQYGSIGSISDSEIGYGISGLARIDIDSGSHVTMENVIVAPESGVAINLRDAGTTLLGSHLHLAGATFATIDVATGASLTLRDCNILNGGALSLRNRVRPETGAVVDVRQCFWGTADSLQVEEWVFDGKDNPIYREALVWPIRDIAIPTQPETVGGFKARFRQR